MVQTTSPSTQEPEKNTVTVVINNQERLEIIQLPALKGKGGLSPGPTIKLIPGVNFPDTKLWEQAKQNPGVQWKLKEKIKPSRAPEQNPEMVGHVMLVERGVVSADNPLSALEDSDAIALIDEIFYPPTLHQLLAEEIRPNVTKALKTQIAKLEKPRTEKKIQM